MKPAILATLASAALAVACEEKGAKKPVEGSAVYLVTGFVDQLEYGGSSQPQFKQYLATVDPSRVRDLSNEVASWDDERRGLDSLPVLVSGGHGSPRNWTVPGETFWLGGMGQTSGYGSHHSIRLGTHGARGGFVCSCQLLGKGTPGPFFNQQGEHADYYHVDPSIADDLGPALDTGLVGLCGFSTYVSCGLVALARPFDGQAWPGADAFEAFMGAGIASTNWPVVPACALRSAASGQPQSVASLSSFTQATPASQHWVIRYVDWIHYPQPVSLLSLFEARPSPRSRVTRASVKPPPPPFTSCVDLARARLKEMGGSGTGAAGVGLVRVAGSGGRQAAGPEAVVVIRDEQSGIPLVRMQPSVVWFDQEGRVKFARVGAELPPEPFRPPLEVKSEADVLDQAKAALGCPTVAPSYLMLGVQKGVESGAFARVNCVRTDAGGQKYMESGLFTLRVLARERSPHR
jgi:hypothetical protein